MHLTMWFCNCKSQIHRISKITQLHILIDLGHHLRSVSSHYTFTKSFLNNLYYWFEFGQPRSITRFVFHVVTVRRNYWSWTFDLKAMVMIICEYVVRRPISNRQSKLINAYICIILIPQGNTKGIVEWYLQSHQQLDLVYVENLRCCQKFHPICRSRKM